MLNLLLNRKMKANNKTFKLVYLQDLARYKGTPGRFLKVYLYMFRYLQFGTNPFLKKLFGFLFSKLSSFKHLEISPTMSIGGVFIWDIYVV